MKIKAIGKTFKVETVDAEIIQGLGADGACLTDKGRILIADNLTEDEEREIVIHELLHAIWSGLGIGYADKTEEKIVTALAKGLRALTVDNSRETINWIFYGE